jgi:hypothetical protein
MTFFEFMLYFGYPLGVGGGMLIALRFHLAATKRQWAQREQKAVRPD